MGRQSLTRTRTDVISASRARHRNEQLSTAHHSAPRDARYSDVMTQPLTPVYSLTRRHRRRTSTNTHTRATAEPSHEQPARCDFKDGVPPRGGISDFKRAAAM